MSQYLLSVLEPSDGTPPADLDRIMADVGEVDRAMHEAGVWVFAGGLHSPSTATARAYCSRNTCSTGVTGRDAPRSAAWSPGPAGCPTPGPRRGPGRR